MNFFIHLSINVWSLAFFSKKCRSGLLQAVSIKQYFTFVDADIYVIRTIA